MLSLSPRFDLFRFEIPRDYIPAEILDKYDEIIHRYPGVVYNSIEYLNESIVGINLPGISDLIQEQPQISYNTITPTDISNTPTLHGRINVEPDHINSTYNSANPLSQINKEFTVTFRQNQGLLNYFMLYETIFYRVCKPYLYEHDHEMFNIDLLSEDGEIISRIKLMQPKISGIDGLEFSYNKIERQTDSFSVTFVFNNIDFDFITK